MKLICFLWQVVYQFYSILYKYCNKVQVCVRKFCIIKCYCVFFRNEFLCVQVVSCDEVFLDVIDLDEKDLEFLALKVRKEIFEIIGCIVSVGIVGNLFMVRFVIRNVKLDS